jgi:putative ABC transport system permease protein
VQHRDPHSPRWRRYLRFWRANTRADVDDELRFHLEERVDFLVERGMDPRIAREEALRRFGDLDGVKKDCQTLAEEQETHMRRTELLDNIRHDVLYAFRLMRAHPGFAIAVALTLALGIGATTAIFSVVHSVLLRPQPYADSERVVMLFETMGEQRGRASAGHFHDWTEQSNALEATAAWLQRNYNITDGEPTRVFGATVTPSFFQVAYMEPALGRYFLPEETAASRVAVISHPLWQTRFDADPGVVGRRVTLNGEAHTIVGVTPAQYTLTQLDERLWTPLSFTPEQRTNYGAHQFTVFGKLKEGVTLEQAQSDLERVTGNIRARVPDEMKNRGVTVASFHEILLGDYRGQLRVILGAVVFVLLIGCANVASLLLARAMSRRKEIAIRGALGGARPRLVGQLLTESVVLAVVGGLLGLVVAGAGVRLLIAMGPIWVPRLAQAGLHLEVLLIAAAATIVCGLLFGVAPALRATRLDLQSELREGGRGSRALVRDRARAFLIVTEMAVALVLLVSAGLFIRSALRLQSIALGFDPNGVTMTRVALPADRYESAASVETAFLRIIERIRGIPGVQRAAAGTRVPMWGGSIDIGIRVDGRPSKSDAPQIGHVRLVTSGFTETLDIPLRSGRLFKDSDMIGGAAWVIVVNETFARSIFGSDDPLGQRISGWTSGDAPEWREIVGVVADVRSFGRDNDIPPEIYIPITQAPQNAWNAFQRAMTIVAKAAPGVAVAPAMRRAVAAVDPLLPVYDLQTMDDVLAQSTATRRFNTLLLTILGMTGLVLAAIGIYGVMSFFVAQRTHEIGVRVALGATTASVVSIVVRQALLLAGLGVIAGGVAAYWATRALASMLFQTDARDPGAFMAGAIVLVLVTLAAAWVPARRAARVEPVRALGAAA